MLSQVYRYAFVGNYLVIFVNRQKTARTPVKPVIMGKEDGKVGEGGGNEGRKEAGDDK